MRSSLALLALLAALPAGCRDGTDPGGAPLRVLFIGNSLTSDNNLPGVVEALGRIGPRPIETGASLLDGSSLEDQWNVGDGLQLLAGSRWDFVVLQQGPSSLATSAELLIAYTVQWAGPIREAGGVPALYAVWPDATREQFFPDVSRHYRQAAEAVDGLFLPAGDAWLAAWALDPDLPLYGSDDFHPSQLGTLLAALTIYGGVTGTVPDLPAELRGEFLTMHLTPAVATLLAQAAREALRP